MKMGSMRCIVCLVVVCIRTCFSGESTYCDACGADASYSETIGSGSIGPIRTVSAGGCPNHYNYCTGKPAKEQCGAKGEEGSGTDAGPRTITQKIPAEPFFASSTTDITCESGAIAIARNGVPFYSTYVSGDCDQLDLTDEDSDWTSFDLCSGHAENSGIYNYQFPPSCLISQLTGLGYDFSDGHSAQLGWAYDGFPIYGPYGAGGVAMKPCEHSEADPTYCTDECGGWEGQLDSVDTFLYRYYTKGTISDLGTLWGQPIPEPDDAPFIMACYKGCTVKDYNTGDCEHSGTEGVTDAHDTSVTLTAILDEFQGYTVETACVITCSSEPTSVDNGSWESDCTGKAVDATCTFTCDSGYEQVESGPDVITCQSTGEWESFSLSCTEVEGFMVEANGESGLSGAFHLNTNKNEHVGLIVGIVSAVVVGVLLAIIVAVFTRRKKLSARRYSGVPPTRVITPEPSSGMREPEVPDTPPSDTDAQTPLNAVLQAKAAKD